jgi:hypothetical protein
MCPGPSVSAFIPEESRVSPLFVEGCHWLSTEDECVIEASGPSGPAVVTLLSYAKFYADIPLAADSASDVRVANTSTGMVLEQTLNWTPTHLVGCCYSTDKLVLRKGDSLLLTAHDPSHGNPERPYGPFRIDSNGDGQPDWEGVDGQTCPAVFNDTGEFVLTAWKVAEVDEVIGTLTVVVVGVELEPPIPCQVGYRRQKNVVVSPAEHVGEVSFAPGDQEVLSVSVKETTSEGARLYLEPLCRGMPVLAARLGATDGPVIASTRIEEFEIVPPSRPCDVVDSRHSSASSHLLMQPFVPELQTVTQVISPAITFGDGTTSLTASTSSWSEITIPTCCLTGSISISNVSLKRYSSSLTNGIAR